MRTPTSLQVVRPDLVILSRPFLIHPSLLNPTILLLGLLDPNKSYSIKEDYLCVSRYSSNTARTAVAHEVTVIPLMGIPLKDNSL